MAGAYKVPGYTNPDRKSTRVLPRNPESFMGSIVRGESGTEREARVPADTQQMLAWAQQYVAERRRRGVDPQGTLFPGELP